MKWFTKYGLKPASGPMLAAVVLLQACGGGGGGGSSAPAGNEYVFGVGDESTTRITVYTDTFTGEKTSGAVKYTFSGTITPLAMGISTYTMTASTDPVDGAALPVVYTAREIEGAMLTLTDNSSLTNGSYSSAMLGLANNGNCSAVSAGDTYQGIFLPGIDDDRSNSPFWATVSVAAGTDGLDLTVQPYYLHEDMQSTPGIGVITVADLQCTGSTLEEAGGSSLLVTPSGLVRLSLPDGSSMLLAPTASSLSSTTLSELGRAYSGFALTPNDAGNGYEGTDDFLGVNALMMNGNYHTVTGSYENIVSGLINTESEISVDKPSTKLLALGKSTGTQTVPEGVFDNTGVDDTAATNGRLFGHTFPDGRQMLFGTYEHRLPSQPTDWTSFFAMQFADPVSVPAAPTGGNSYRNLTPDGGIETYEQITVDTAAGQYMNISSIGQASWGSAVVNDQGFISLIIEGTSVAEDRGDIPMAKTAFEIPGGMLNIVDTSDTTLGNAYANSTFAFNMGGSCATAGSSYNYVTIPDAGFDQAIDDAYGQLALSTGAAGLDANIDLWMLGVTTATTPFNTVSADMVCISSTLGNAEVVINHSASGMNFLRAAGALRISLPENALTSATLHDVNRSYAGIIRSPRDISGMGDWSMVTRFLDASGSSTSITGTPYTDVVAGTLSATESAELTLAPASTSGLFNASTLATDTLHLSAYPSSLTGRHILVGIVKSDTNGDGDTDDALDFLNVILYEK